MKYLWAIPYVEHPAKKKRKEKIISVQKSNGLLAIKEQILGLYYSHWGHNDIPSARPDHHIITIIIRRRFRALGKHYFITEKIISYHHHQGLWGRRRDDKYPNAIRNPKRVSSSDGQGAIQLGVKKYRQKKG